jgi:hypothetical protein
VGGAPVGEQHHNFSIVPSIARITGIRTEGGRDRFRMADYTTTGLDRHSGSRWVYCREDQDQLMRGEGSLLAAKTLSLNERKKGLPFQRASKTAANLSCVLRRDTVTPRALVSLVLAIN